MRKTIVPSAMLAATMLIAAPALAAQDTPQPDPSQPSAPETSPSQVKVGDAVYDSTGASVGTIQAIEGDAAILSTGTGTVRIPASAISQGAKGATIPVTKAELEAEAAKSSQPQ